MPPMCGASRLPRRLAPLLAVAALAASAGCRREPRAADGSGPAADRSPAAGASASPSGADAAPGPGTTAAPSSDAGRPAPAGDVLVPPAPSGWAPGAEFHAPPPIVVTDVPSVSGFNMLQNPGFEGATEPWWFFPDRPHWGGFTVTDDRALSGRWAARLELLVDADHPPPGKAHIRGVIQDIQSPVFPTRISGSYFVERWERGTVDQYLQFVVIVAGAAMSGGSVTNTQIRYLLAGIDHPPFGIANAKFFYVTRGEPVVGE
jgi:hypothetical protein